MKRLMIVLAAVLAISPAFATNNPPNECGNHGNNCGGGDGGNATGGAGGNGTGVGIGVGVGLGGNAQGGAGGRGGEGGDGGSGVAVVSGVSGGDASSAVIGSGNSQQGQHQGQGQHQSNVGINGQSLHSAVNASSRNANQSSAAGNTTVTNVGGDSTLVERNAPPVFLGAITPTSCGGSFNAGGSSRDGAGGLGFSWVGKECRIRQVGDRYHALGMVDTACEIYKTTKGFRDAAKANPKLRDLDCTVKPAAVPATVVPQAFLEAHTPRG